MTARRQVPAPAKSSKRAAPVEEDLNEEDLLIPEEMAALEDEDRLRKFKEMFSGRAYAIRVEKKNAQAKLVTVTRIPFDDFDPYDLQVSYGGGEYVCTLIDAENRYVKGGRTTWLFADLPKATPEPDKPKSALEDPVVQFLLNSQKENTAMMIEMMKTFAPKPGGDATLATMVETLKGLRTLTPDGKGNDLESMMKTFATMKDLFDSGGGDKDEGIMSAIKEALPIVQMLRGGGGFPGQPARRPAAPPAPPAAHVPALEGPIRVPGSPTEVIEGDKTVKDPVEVAVNAQIPVFVGVANTGGDPAKAGTYLVKVLETNIVPALKKKYGILVSEDTIWDKLIEAAEDPEKIEAIFTYAPALADHREWVLAVIKAALDEVAEDVPEGGDNASGNNAS